MDKTKKYVLEFIILSFVLIGIITLYNMNASSTKTEIKKEEVTQIVPQDNSEKDQKDKKTTEIDTHKEEATSNQKQENKKSNSSKNEKISESQETSVTDLEQKEYISVIIYGIEETMASGKIEYQQQNAYDVLKTLCSQKGLEIKTTGSGITVYVKSINGLAERDYGAMSGWKYKVNGNYPNIGAGQYKLSVNDKVEWVYDKAE